MPFDYDVDASRRFIVVTATLPVSVEAWVEMLHRAISDPGTEAGFDIVFDRRRLAYAPDTAEVRNWVRQNAQLVSESGGGRLAIIVDEPVAYGMMRMASTFAEFLSVQVSVFWSVEEALAWLGRGPASRS